MADAKDVIGNMINQADSDNKITMCGLSRRDQELLVLMRWIDSQGGFNLKPGRLTIDFSETGEIQHFNISQTFNGIFRL